MGTEAVPWLMMLNCGWSCCVVTLVLSQKYWSSSVETGPPLVLVVDDEDDAPPVPDEVDEVDEVDEAPPVPNEVDEEVVVNEVVVDEEVVVDDVVVNEVVVDEVVVDNEVVVDDEVVVDEEVELEEGAPPAPLLATAPPLPVVDVVELVEALPPTPGGGTGARPVAQEPALATATPRAKSVVIQPEEMWLARMVKLISGEGEDPGGDARSFARVKGGVRAGALDALGPAWLSGLLDAKGRDTEAQSTTA